VAIEDHEPRGVSFRSRLRAFPLPLRLGLVILAIAAYYYMGEKIPVRDGYGYDGRNYAEIVELYPGWVESYADSYRIQRVLPAVTCAAVMQVLGIERRPAAIVRGFVTLNALALAVSFLATLGIARTLRFDAVRTVGLFSACFLSYALVKLPSFYPILTDHVAASLGLVLTFLYLRGRSLALALCTAVSAFVWPTLPLLGVLFLSFPYGTRIAVPPRVVRVVSVVVPLVLGIGFLLFAFEIYGARHFQHWAFDPASRGWFVSVPLALVYLVAGAYYVCQSLRGDGKAPETFRDSLRRLPWKSIVLAVALLASLRLTQGLLVSAQSRLSQHEFLLRVVAYATEKPLIFLVAHVAFFGPAFLLVVLGFPRLCREAFEAGLALQVVLGAFVVFTLFSESRSFTPWWGPICVFSVKAFDLWGDRQVVTVLGLLQALGTQVWLRPGLFVPGDIGEFPAQWYFMNFGPWMGDKAYFFFAAYTAAVVALLLVRQARRSTSEPPRPEENVDRAVVA
jgi:hypothetical protein